MTIQEIEKEREYYEKFIQIKEAYEILINPQTKEQYDKYIGNYVNKEKPNKE